MGPAWAARSHDKRIGNTSKIVEVEYETVDSKEGEAEAEDVNKTHH